jgi:excisionase family DNA binding protein
MALGISRSLAYELSARGELPALRLGGRLVIPRAHLEALLGSTETHSVTDKTTRRTGGLGLAGAPKGDCTQ